MFKIEVLYYAEFKKKMHRFAYSLADLNIAR